MAIAYLRANNIKAGQSAVAAAAYRSGEILTDQQDGQTKNYHIKMKEVVFDKIYLPEQAPAEFSSKENLWNSAQWAELNTKPGENGEHNLRAGARFAKALTIAIPNEFSLTQEKNAMDKIAAFFTSQGYGVQINIHHPDKLLKNLNNKSNVKSQTNHHAHIMITARKITATGFDLSAPKQKKDYVYVLDENGNKVPELDKAGKPKLNQRKQPVYKRVPLLDENGQQRYRERKGKGRELLWQTKTVEVNWLDDAQTLTSLKDYWAEICNRELEKEKDKKKISFHTYEKIAQMRDLKPEFRLEPQIHVGVAGWSMMQKGKANERADANEDIKQKNRKKLSVLGLTYDLWLEQAESPLPKMYNFSTAIDMLKKLTAGDELISELRRLKTFEELYNKRKNKGNAPTPNTKPAPILAPAPAQKQRQTRRSNNDEHEIK